MKKMKFLFPALLLNGQFVWASENKIDLDVEFMWNNEVVQFKTHTKVNESTSVTNHKYRMEIKSDILDGTTEKTTLKTFIQIFDIQGNQKKLLMSPSFVLTDGVSSTFVTEDSAKNDIIQIKVTPHIVSTS